jgi:P27 family predicted phage terminase small subunit
MGGANSGRKPDAATRYQRAKSAAVSFPAGTPEPPEGLCERSMEKWSHAVEMLRSVPGMLTKADAPLLEQYAHAWEEFYAADDAVKAVGLTVSSEKGGVYQNPSVGIRHKAQAAIVALAKLMRFDHKGRGPFGATEDPKDERSAFAKLMDGRRVAQG